MSSENAVTGTSDVTPEPTRAETAIVAHSADGTAIAYEIHGDGPGVILIDGAMCFRDSGPMRAVCAQLDDDFAVLTYDRRGRGRSGDTPPYSVDRELDDLEALVEVVNETSAPGSTPALVGISSGGALALRAAARLGDRVRAVAVYEPPYMPAEFAMGARDYTHALGAALASGDRDTALSLFLARVGMPEQAVAGMRRSPAWRGMLALAPTLAYDDAALGDSAVPTELIASIAVPVLALAGGASPELMQYGAHGVAESAERGAYDTLAGQSHDADATVLTARVRGFLRP